MQVVLQYTVAEYSAMTAAATLAGHTLLNWGAGGMTGFTNGVIYSEMRCAEGIVYVMLTI